MKIRLRRGVKAQLPTLSEGEPGWVTDEGKLYIGTGAANIPMARDDHSHTYSSLKELPATMPPSGAAGGDLEGYYPNPAVKRIAITDTRDLDLTPSECAKKKVAVEFKYCRVVGIDTSSGLYCSVITLAQWSDKSGGVPVQIAVTQDNRLQMRISAPDMSAWGPWVRLSMDGHTHLTSDVIGDLDCGTF